MVPPLTAITFCHVSPNPHGSPKTIFTTLGEKDPNNIWQKKFSRIEIFVFEIAKVEVH